MSLTPTQRFWRLLQPDQKEIRNVYVYAVFNGLVSLSLPLGIQAIINLIQGGQVSTSWIVLVCLVVIGVIATGVLQIFQLRITENLQQKIFTRASFELAHRIPRIRMEALYKHYAPELMNRFFDIMSVQKGLSKILIDFSTATLHVVFGLLLLSFYHPFFIFFSLILVLLVYLIFTLTVKKGLSTSLLESKHKYEVAYWLEELARTLTTFKLAGNTNLPMKRTDHYVGEYLGAREEHFKILVRQYSLLVGFKAIVAMGLLAIGGWLVMDQRMNIGQFVAAEIIILLVMGSVEKLILSLETIYDVLTGLAKIGHVTDLELENNEGINLVDECTFCGLELDLTDVSFRFPGDDHNTLQKINLSVASDERLIVIGPNGSGKSTLLQMLAGLYDTNEGSIAYNGLPKGNLQMCSVRAVVGDFLSQEDLFEGTVMDNLTMGRETVTFDNVKWAVQALGLEGFIQGLPKGYETVLSPEGRNIPRSVGQKLLLARSIVDKPKMLLLEDALEHLDGPEQRSIIDFLVHKSRGWTLIAASANPYLAKHADRIAWMENGQITKIGTYEEMKDLLSPN